MGQINRIFELADQKYKEQRDFAKDLGIAASVVSAWRTGKSASYNKYLPQIAEVLGTTVEYLLTGNAPQPAVPAELSDEDAEILRQIHDRPGMRLMFSVTSKATDEEIQRAARIIEALLQIPEE